MQSSWKVVNVVSSATLGTKFSMKDLNQKLPSCQYKPKKFHAIILPVKNRVKCLIFESGKAVCVGATAVEEGLACLQLVVDKLSGIGYNCAVTNFAVKNIVISGSFGSELWLLPLKQDCKFSIWEPELFPGLTYWMKEPVKATALVFCSGKFIITGLKQESDIVKAFEHLASLASRHLHIKKDSQLK